MAGRARTTSTTRSALCLCLVVAFSQAPLSATQPADPAPDAPPVASRLSQPPVPLGAPEKAAPAVAGAVTDAGDVAALRGLLDAVAAGNATILNGVTTAGDPWCAAPLTSDPQRGPDRKPRRHT